MDRVTVGSALLVLLLVSFRDVLSEEFKEVLRWKQLDFGNVTDATENAKAGRQQGYVTETFDPYQNVPMGVAHHKGRLFLGIPRRRSGVPATLAVIHLDQITKENRSPKLLPYPDFVTNQLRESYRADPDQLVSVFRTRVDRCDRLWLVDTGSIGYPAPGRRIQRPSLWVIELSTNRRVRRFEMPVEIVPDGFGIATLAVDSDADACNNAFAYIPDISLSRLYVYSFSEDRMWYFRHEFFAYEPRQSGFNVAGLQFRWDDGLFSIAVGPLLAGSLNSRIVFLHAMASTTEYWTTTHVLQNETIATSGDYDQFFKLLGDRGTKTQSTIHQYDPATGVLFYAEVNRNSIGCWNSSQPFDPDHHGIVHLDNKKLIYPSDMTLDVDGELWVLTNAFPRWLYGRLDSDVYNFRIWRQKPSKAIVGTICDVRAT